MVVVVVRSQEGGWFRERETVAAAGLGREGGGVRAAEVQAKRWKREENHLQGGERHRGGRGRGEMGAGGIVPPGGAL